MKVTQFLSKILSKKNELSETEGSSNKVTTQKQDFTTTNSLWGYLLQPPMSLEYADSYIFI